MNDFRRHTIHLCSPLCTSPQFLRKLLNDAKHVYAFLWFYKAVPIFFLLFSSYSFCIPSNILSFLPTFTYISRNHRGSICTYLTKRFIIYLSLVSKSSPVIIFKCLLYPADANAKLDYKSRKRFKGYSFSSVYPNLMS